MNKEYKCEKTDVESEKGVGVENGNNGDRNWGIKIILVWVLILITG